MCSLKLASLKAARHIPFFKFRHRTFQNNFEMFGKLKFLILLITLCVVVNEVTTICKKAKKKCKKKGHWNNLTTPSALKGTTTEAGRGPDVGNGVVALDESHVQEFVIGEKYRTATYQKIYLPRDTIFKNVVDVLLDGKHWVWPKNSTHMLQNSSGYQSKMDKEIPLHNNVSNFLDDVKDAKMFATFRIVSSDGVCVEAASKEDSGRARETSCYGSEYQRFSLRSTAFSDTFLLQTRNQDCVKRGGYIVTCDVRDEEQKFIRQKKKLYQRADNGLLCPFSLGFGKPAFDMHPCQPVRKYYYRLEEWSHDYKSELKFVRAINSDGMCLAIYATEVRSHICKEGRWAPTQQLRKIERPEGHFRLESLGGGCIREVVKDKGTMTIFDATEECLDTIDFSYDENMKKLVTTTSNCVTMWCVKNDCDPRYKKVVSRSCSGVRSDQLFDIEQFRDTNLETYRKTWLAVHVYPGDDWFIRCPVRGVVISKCRYGGDPKGTPTRWYKTDETKGETHEGGKVLQMTSTTSIMDSFDTLTMHYMFTMYGEWSGNRWDCDTEKGVVHGNLCMGFVNNINETDVTDYVYVEK